MAVSEKPGGGAQNDTDRVPASASFNKVGLPTSRPRASRRRSKSFSHRDESASYSDTSGSGPYARTGGLPASHPFVESLSLPSATGSMPCLMLPERPRTPQAQIVPSSSHLTPPRPPSSPSLSPPPRAARKSSVPKDSVSPTVRSAMAELSGHAQGQSPPQTSFNDDDAPPIPDPESMKETLDLERQQSFESGPYYPANETHFSPVRPPQFIGGRTRSLHREFSASGSKRDSTWSPPRTPSPVAAAGDGGTSAGSPSPVTLPRRANGASPSPASPSKPVQPPPASRPSPQVVTAHADTCPKRHEDQPDQPDPRDPRDQNKLHPPSPMVAKLPEFYNEDEVDILLKPKAARTFDDLPFDLFALPPPEVVQQAATCKLMSLEGEEVRFGDLLPSANGAGTPASLPPRTLVLFLRHMFCGLCQDYVQAMERSLNAAALKSSNVRVIFVTHGDSVRALRGYRKAFKLSYELYCDPTPNRDLYQALGMTLMSKWPQPTFQRHEYNASGPRVQAIRGLFNGITKHPTAIRGMLQYKQLGGEFLFGSGYQCEFAHRMYHMGDHWDVSFILRAAGIPYPPPTKSVEAIDKQLVDSKFEAYRTFHQYYKSKAVDKYGRPLFRVNLELLKMPSTDNHATLHLPTSPPPLVSASQSSVADSMGPQSVQSTTQCTCVSPMVNDNQDNHHASLGRSLG